MSKFIYKSIILKNLFFLSSYCISGPVFIQPSDIPNRDQLIITSKCSYEREVVKRDGPSTQILLNDIKGKCSVFSLKHFCTRKFYFYIFAYYIIGYFRSFN
jgi:hypothetical protein